MPDDARHKHFAGRKLYFLPDTPFVLVPRIGCFNGDRVRFHFQNEIDDVAQRDIVFVRAMIAAPTGMKPNPVGRDVAQSMIERVDTQLGILAVFRHRHVAT